MNVFAHSKMQFNIVRPNVRGRVLRLVLIKGGGQIGTVSGWCCVLSSQCNR